MIAVLGKSGTKVHHFFTIYIGEAVKNPEMRLVYWRNDRSLSVITPIVFKVGYYLLFLAHSITLDGARLCANSLAINFM